MSKQYGRQASRGSRLGMEATLHARDQTGVQDFVLLEDYKSEDAFVDNLKKRFQENLIYTYIGPVLISINPYKQLNIYDKTITETYRNVNFYELPPHIYAISDAAYRSMRAAFQDQCVLISGESGSGKTEASKKILHYIAASSTHSLEVKRVKDRLLQSNPILEAFGNAKTNRNDNSSRFGKYMDVQFDFKGAPVGGVILNYLLEKSRVIHQAPGERNFHVFYQLVRSADTALLDKLCLKNDVEAYYYLNQGDCSYSGGYTSGVMQNGTVTPDTLNDAADWKVVKAALDVCGFSSEDQKHLFAIVASILHLGNIGFLEEDELAVPANTKPVQIIAKLLGCSDDDLLLALTNKSIMAERKKVTSPLTRDQAIYARDAFSKGTYERLFRWLVSRINQSLATKSKGRTTVLGLLDIYGFEIFEANSFEQFCINYCNEKLQQLFITLTLKSEQEEYLREGIEWEPVKYFNNKIICDLVEIKPTGIISLLDEECLRPGNPTDASFLDKLSSQLKGHAHFLSYATANGQQRKTISREEFRLVHYAGEVTYHVKGFLDKNNDLLFRDLKEVMGRADNPILKHCFPQSELISKKRPETAGTQFRSSLSQLMDILMSKEPSYIRCIKPNDYKRPNTFDDEIILHQVKYLGLMENLRVRRAGFAYRREYKHFLRRYKSLCPKTWPRFMGSPKQGVQVLCEHLNYGSDDYKMGKKKVFIRFPRVLFATEDALQLRKHELATSIQAKYKMHVARKLFLIKKNSVTRIASMWRMILAQRLLERRRKAATAIRKFVKGFILRHQPLCEENRMFINSMRYNFLMRLLQKLPMSVLDKSWPQPPAMLQQTSDHLHKLNTGNLVKKYMLRLTAERKKQFEEKVIAERLFKGKKELYRPSVGKYFAEERLVSNEAVLYNNVFKMTIKSPTEEVKYVCPAVKYDSKGYTRRDRVFVATTEALYVLNQKDFKLKQKIPLSVFQGVSISALSDTVCVFHTELDKNNNKADVILSLEHVIEALTKVVIACGKEQVIQFQNGSISHKKVNGKEGLIEFCKGDQYNVAKKKNALAVTAT